MAYSGKGRPSKIDEITDSQWKALIEAVGLGVPYAFVAHTIEVTDRTFYGWMKRGEEDHDAGTESPFADFFQRVEAAKAGHVVKAHKAMNEGERGHKGHEWILSRRHPQHFHQGTKVEHSGHLDSKQSVTVFDGDLLDQLEDVDDMDDSEESP